MHTVTRKLSVSLCVFVRRFGHSTLFQVWAECQPAVLVKSWKPTENLSYGFDHVGPVVSEVINIAAARTEQTGTGRQVVSRRTYDLLILGWCRVNVDGTTRAVTMRAMPYVDYGVGNWRHLDFSTFMHFECCTDNGRDICQFVEFSKHKHISAVDQGDTETGLNN
jgi:hypothetical protein